MNKCPKCNVELVYYDGCLGYESFVCPVCHLDWPKPDQIDEAVLAGRITPEIREAQSRRHPWQATGLERPKNMKEPTPFTPADLHESIRKMFRLPPAEPEAPRPCSTPHCPATAAIGDTLCHDCRRQTNGQPAVDRRAHDEPEPRDIDTPMRPDQDRIDWEERQL